MRRFTISSQTQTDRHRHGQTARSEDMDGMDEMDGHDMIGYTGDLQHLPLLARQMHNSFLLLVTTPSSMSDPARNEA